MFTPKISGTLKVEDFVRYRILDKTNGKLNRALSEICASEHYSAAAKDLSAFLQKRPMEAIFDTYSIVCGKLAEYRLN